MNKILILTASGSNYGSGHLHRMKALHSFLTSKNISTDILDIIQDNISSINNNTLLKAQPDLIIRDMRDSTEEEILNLKKYCPIITLDDVGPGNKISNENIYLLPNLLPEYSFKQMKYFIYGDSFTKYFTTRKNNSYCKDIDFLYYCTGKYPEKDITLIRNSIPKSFSLYILYNNNIFKESFDIQISNFHYCEALLKTRVLISHYGILQFEAKLCGCKNLSINPTDYHEKLSLLTNEYLNNVNAGTYHHLREDKLEEAINIILENYRIETPDISQINMTITENLDRFYTLLQPYL